MEGKEKNVLYLSYDGMTDPLGQSQVLPYLIGLGKRGYGIWIISCEKDEAKANTITIAEICRANNLHWHPISYTRKPPIISTIKDVRNMRKVAAKLQEDANFQIVHCRSYIAALVGLGMKKRYGTKFLFDMRGFWADERVDGGLWNLKNPMFRLVFNYFKKKEKIFLQQADAVISLTHCAKAEIESWHLPHTAPITVIPCCADTHLFDPKGLTPAAQLALRKTLNIATDTNIVGYVGSVGTWYLLREMLDFFKIWIAKHADSVLLFVTPEPPAIILEAAKAAGISGDALRIVKGKRAEMPGYIGVMDLGLFFIKPAYSKKASSPVKQGEIMAMGLPVICNAGVGDSDFIIKEYNSGVLVNQFNTSGYEEAIREWDAKQFSAEHIRKGALAYFELEKGVDSYQGVYERMNGL